MQNADVYITYLHRQFNFQFNSISGKSYLLSHPPGVGALALGGVILPAEESALLSWEGRVWMCVWVMKGGVGALPLGLPETGDGWHCCACDYDEQEETEREDRGGSCFS